jgi:hypothetical protein
LSVKEKKTEIVKTISVLKTTNDNAGGGDDDGDVGGADADGDVSTARFLAEHSLTKSLR